MKNQILPSAKDNSAYESVGNILMPLGPVQQGEDFSINVVPSPIQKLRDTNVV